MKQLWQWIERKSWKRNSKYQVFTLLCALISAMLGLILWGLISPFAFSSLDWMICFLGYPVVCSFFLVFFYASRHPFSHTKKNCTR